MTERYSRTARTTVAILCVLVLVEAFFLYREHLMVERLIKVDCAATKERMGRITLYDTLIAQEEKLMLRAPEKDVFFARIEGYRAQQKLVRDTITVTDFACDPQAVQYLHGIPLAGQRVP